MPCDRLIVKIAEQYGRRHFELGKSWASSVATYGAVMAIGIVYFTDWKVIATKIPIYNTKFKDN